jgi:hypothetical protein
VEGGIVQTATALLSVAALIVACVSLWRAHLAPFSPISAAGRLTLTADQITHEREWWYVLRVMVTVSVTNAGARAGVITDARVVAHYLDHPVNGAHESFDLVGELDPAKYHTLKSRSDLFREAFRGPGMPFTVLPKDTVSELLMFSTRWDHEAPIEQVRWELQLRINGQGWRTVQQWTCQHKGVSAFDWPQLRAGSSFGYAPDGSPHPTVIRHPVNLDDPACWM